MNEHTSLEPVRSLSPLPGPRSAGLSSEAWVVCSSGDWQWQVRPEWKELLLEPQRAVPGGGRRLAASGLRLQQWQGEGRLFLLKQAPHRTLFRLELERGTLFVKHYPVGDWRAWLRQRLRPSKARSEAEAACRLRELGIPTAEPVAVGETRTGESCLITLGLADAVSLRQALEDTSSPAVPPGERHRLTRELAELVARMHEAGIGHGDWHAGNILLARRPDGGTGLYLIDLFAVCFGACRRASRPWGELIALNRWFVQRVSRADRLRFWKHYLAARPSLHCTPAQMRKMARDLERRTWASCLRYWRERDRRCLRHGSKVRRLRSEDGVGYCVADLPEAVLTTLLADPDCPFCDAAAVVKQSPSGAVAVVQHPAGPTLAWKRFTPTRWLEGWLAWLRPPPGLRSWINAHRLRECGLPTPGPLLVWQRWRGGRLLQEYLLTPWVPQARTLAQHWHSTPTLAARRQLVERVARLIREMHRRGLSHRDLKAANILVDAEGRVHLIDLVGIHRPGWLGWRRKVQNLARLHVSFCHDPSFRLADRLRFLRVYLEWGLHGRQGWKRWWRAIAEATRAKLAQNRRRQRPLS
jgi:tRNA A-37 threonylcarbamoyl transferase component Bud32